MIEVVWEFHVKPQKLFEFEREYSERGPWAKLFGESTKYHGTQLLRDRDNGLRFLTIDRWDDLASYENFRGEHSEAYRELDEQFEQLTEDEKLIGIFEVL